MGRRRLVAALAAALLIAAACSDDGVRGSASSREPVDADPAAAEEASEISVMYAQHAIFGTAAAADDDGSILTLSGVDQTTAWMSDSMSGVMTTAEFIESWETLGLAASPPQAAFVPADPATPPVIVQLADPSFDAERRTITYSVRPVTQPEDRLEGMLTSATATLPESFAVVSLLISQPDAPALPDDTVTTTSSSIPPDTAAPPETTPATNSSSTPTSESTDPTFQPPPETQPSPSGPARITASPSSLTFPTSGGPQYLTLTNTGSGVGSWSISTQDGTGISTSPSSGYLFPGSSVIVVINFNGRGPNSDFATQLDVFTSSGSFVIPIVVGG